MVIMRERPAESTSATGDQGGGRRCDRHGHPTYSENEIRRIAVKGFEIAMKRRKKVTSVDKANVLDLPPLEKGGRGGWRRMTTRRWSCPICWWTTAPMQLVNESGPV